MMTTQVLGGIIFFTIILTNVVISTSSNLNPHNFKLLINPEYKICNNKSNDIFLLVYVHTAPENHKKRLVIRQTWASTSLMTDLKMVFVMGLSKSQQVNDLLKLEHSIYGDIIQEDFEDTYRNLTYKGIAALKWISKYCNNKSKYILKVDDDVIVNTFLLRRHLKTLAKHNANSTTKAIMCHVYKRMRVIRNKKSKWYLSKKEFKDDRFKTYCTGAAFLMTPDLIKPMYEASLNVEFFWIDDYYVTGLLAKEVDAVFYNFNSLYVINPKYVKRMFVYKKPDWIVFGHFSHLPDTLSQMQFIWDYIRPKFTV